MPLKSIVLLLPFALLLMISCQFQERIKGSKEIIKFEIPVKQIDKVNVSGVYDLTILQGQKESVIVNCNANIEEHLNIYQKNKTIYLEMDNISSNSNLVIEATITIKDLKAISCSGATDVHIEYLNFDNLFLDLSGASKIKGIDISANDLNISASGASTARLDGKVKTLITNLTGASRLKGKDLWVTKSANIEASGASNVSVTLNCDFDVSLSGASELRYYGTGKSIKQDISGVSEMVAK